MKLVFVCTGNYYRSRFAEFYFNLLCDSFSIKTTVSSRGFEVELSDYVTDKFGQPHPLTMLEIKKHSNYISEQRFSFYRNKVREPMTQLDFDNNDFIVIMDKDEHEKYLSDYNFNSEKIVFWEEQDVYLGKTPTECFNGIKIKCESLFMKLFRRELLNE